MCPDNIQSCIYTMIHYCDMRAGLSLNLPNLASEDNKSQFPTDALYHKFQHQLELAGARSGAWLLFVARRVHSQPAQSNDVIGQLL